MSLKNRIKKNIFKSTTYPNKICYNKTLKEPKNYVCHSSSEVKSAYLKLPW